jgi:hypothetical protein
MNGTSLSGVFAFSLLVLFDPPVEFVRGADIPIPVAAQENICESKRHDSMSFLEKRDGLPS